MDVTWTVNTHEVLTMAIAEQEEQDWRQEERTVHHIKEVLLFVFLNITRARRDGSAGKGA